ncbi:MAG: hypothetical protein JWO30_4621 [Fibrobacteres bacterium]|nr:hypothetical protein [Fibrobacterota bacterium]
MALANQVVCETRSFKLAFQNDASVNIGDINDEILDSVSKYAIKAVLGYTKKGRAVTFEELASNGITENLPADGSEVVKVLTFDFKEEKLFVMDKQSIIPLSRLKMTVAYRRGEEPESEEPTGEKPLDAEDDDYTADVFVKTKEG